MYRRLECSTWDDPWFSELAPDAKLLFLYLITNRRTTACGVFEITLRAIAFETGIGQTGDIEDVLRELKDRVTWWPEHQVIFVKNFYRWQSDATNKGNFRIGAIRALSEFPPEIVATVTHVYPELRSDEVSHPHPIPIPSPSHGEEETVTVEEEETVEVEVEEDKHTARSAPVRVSYPDDFEVFWKEYPSGNGSKKSAYAQWCKLKPDEDLRLEIMHGLALWNRSDRWQRGYVKDSARWLRDQLWTNPPPQNGAVQETAKSSEWRRKQNRLLAIANGEQSL